MNELSEEKIRAHAKRMAENFYSTAIMIEANIVRLKKRIAETGKTEEELKAEQIEILTAKLLNEEEKPMIMVIRKGRRCGMKIKGLPGQPRMGSCSITL
jgi:hypothetical protein